MTEEKHKIDGEVNNYIDEWITVVEEELHRRENESV